MNWLKTNKIYFIFVLSIFVVYIATKLIFSESIFITQEFADARLQSALVSENIIKLATEIKNNVRQINNLEQEKKYKEAFSLLNETNLKILDIRQKAVDLSKQLEVMTKELNNIKAKNKEPLVISAITQRITIINHLINYSDYLFQLNLALEKRFYGANNKDEIISLVDKINSEVEVINELNQRANENMFEFDHYLQGSIK